jgi:hypothetical protein
MPGPAFLPQMAGLRHQTGTTNFLALRLGLYTISPKTAYHTASGQATPEAGEPARKWQAGLHM